MIITIFLISTEATNSTDHCKIYEIKVMVIKSVLSNFKYIEGPSEYVGVTITFGCLEGCDWLLHWFIDVNA